MHTSRADASPELAVRAHAKINLTLDVLGRRPDGYHALRSVMQALELHDTLELRTAPALGFSCDDPALSGDDNLVPRAARLLQLATGCTTGAHIGLHKRIPTEAGLGGGSSDAAAALVGLNSLWELGLAPSRLAELGAELGSDVPFFLYAPTALVSGRGDAVEALRPLPRAYVVLHKPPHGVSTRRVFGALPPGAYGGSGGTDALLAALDGDLPPELWPLSNGLQDTVVALYPEVGSALARVRRAGAPNPIMTGSGSAVYALFGQEHAARRVYEKLVESGQDAILTETVAG